MPPIIKVENLSKQYRLGNVGTGTLKDDFKRSWYKVRGREDPFLKIGDTNDRSTRANSDYVWALKDINFEVQAGEVLGIIGRNGAGKSTLLKILSRVAEPTTGRITMDGRVASLLEVGTGFHGELTGRENIFLNGAILGMKKQEIKSKLDEIIDFSGVERYIDTPVKRYSSGMYVRLGFAVAAHLEPEILIVDEVLAVGDAEFQKKCLGKMKDVSIKEGRTVLFVSHNMAAIQNLCNRVFILNNGCITTPPVETALALDNYVKDINSFISNIPINQRMDRAGIGFCRVTEFSIYGNDNINTTSLFSGQFVSFDIVFQVSQTDVLLKDLEVAISITKAAGEHITLLSSKFLGEQINVGSGLYKVRFDLEKLPLVSGAYTMNVCIKEGNTIQDWVQEAKLFEVTNGDYYRTGKGMPESHQGVYVNFRVCHEEAN